MVLYVDNTTVRIRRLPAVLSEAIGEVQTIHVCAPGGGLTRSSGFVMRGASAKDSPLRKFFVRLVSRMLTQSRVYMYTATQPIPLTS